MILNRSLLTESGSETREREGGSLSLFSLTNREEDEEAFSGRNVLGA